MRIAIDCRAMQDTFVAGIGQYIYYLLENLGEMDHANQYVLFYNSFSKKFLRGLPDFKYKNFKTVKDRIPNMLFACFDRKFFPRFLFSDLLTGKIDIFHGTNCLLPYNVYNKAVLSYHDLSILTFPQFHPLPRRMVYSRGRLKMATENCRLITACSQATKADLVNVLGVIPEKIKVIYYAASPEFMPMPDKENISRVLLEYGIKEKFILFVGTVEPRKNIERLLIAYKLARGKYKIYHKLVIVGGKGWLYDEIFRCFHKLQLEDSVKFIGYIKRQDLVYLYNGASAFVYPSINEGFGLPPLEAMACGTPCLVSNNSSFPEVVGEAALKIDPYSVEEIAGGIRRLLTDETLRSDLIEKGLVRSKSFSWSKTASQTLEVYKEAYASIKGRR